MRVKKKYTMLAKRMPCLYRVKSYCGNPFFAKTAIFRFYFLSLESKPLILGQNWGHASKGALKEPSIALFRGAVALLFPSYVPICRKMLKTAKFDLWSLLVTWPKIDRSISVLIFYALSTAADLVSLRDPGAELEGGVTLPPSTTRKTQATSTARAKFNFQIDLPFKVSLVHSTRLDKRNTMLQNEWRDFAKSKVKLLPKNCLQNGYF